MGIEWNSISREAKGGTELLCRRIERDVDPALLDMVQIVPSRLEGELDPTKIRIFYGHDLAGDPESDKILGDQGWRRFHVLVFVSHWQMNAYVLRYQIPWSRCVVIQNSIDPLPDRDGWVPGQPFRFVFHTTPHRGLDILVPVFEKLAEKHDDVTLDVYSSFVIYGEKWTHRNTPYQALFERIETHPRMSYHGAVSNEEVRQALLQSHAFAYPCTWPETSCLALIEAMSAGLFCFHPNMGALFETSGLWTNMYQFNENKDQHAGVLYSILDDFLSKRGDERTLESRLMDLQNAKNYSRLFYNWQTRRGQWEALIRGLEGAPRGFESERIVFDTSRSLLS
jgi:glycosyltransferase involved in cell wall biosynthesis